MTKLVTPRNPDSLALVKAVPLSKQEKLMVKKEFIMLKEKIAIFNSRDSKEQINLQEIEGEYCVRFQFETDRKPAKKFYGWFDSQCDLIFNGDLSPILESYLAGIEVPIPEIKEEEPKKKKGK